MRARRIVRKLEKDVLKRLGQDLTIRRNQLTNDTEGLDFFGEPVSSGSYTNFNDRIIRVFIDEVKYDENVTTIGGISDQAREMIKCCISQSEDIAIGDHIFYPAESTISYEIEKISPLVYKDTILIYEIDAYREATTNIHG